MQLKNIENTFTKASSVAVYQTEESKEMAYAIKNARRKVLREADADQEERGYVKS